MVYYGEPLILSVLGFHLEAKYLVLCILSHFCIDFGV